MTSELTPRVTNTKNFELHATLSELSRLCNIAQHSILVRVMIPSFASDILGSKQAPWPVTDKDEVIIPIPTPFSTSFLCVFLISFLKALNITGQLPLSIVGFLISYECWIPT